MNRFNFFKQSRGVCHWALRLILCLSACFTSLCAQAQTCPLQCKRIAVIGDSYVRNHREPVENTWHYKFAKKHGMQYLNYGRNGSCISIDLKQWGPSVLHRAAKMADSLDYIIVIAGHNDAARLDSLGTDFVSDKVNELCQLLVNRYPTARIYFFTPWSNDNPNYLKVVDIEKTVCGSWGIPVFDAARNSNIFARSDAFRNVYFQNGARDHAHLNAKGHDRFLPVAEAFILSH